MTYRDISADFYHRASVAGKMAAIAKSTDTKANLLELEQLWLSQARKHEARYVSAR
jgi:hypothetical protein